MKRKWTCQLEGSTDWVPTIIPFHVTAPYQLLSSYSDRQWTDCRYFCSALQKSQISCPGIPGSYRQKPLLCPCFAVGGNTPKEPACFLRYPADWGDDAWHMKYCNRNTGRTPSAKFRPSLPRCSSTQFPSQAKTEAHHRFLLINNQILDQDRECNQRTYLCKMNEIRPFRKN